MKRPATLQLPSQTYLQGLFNYDPETGILMWNKGKGRRCGEAGTITHRDYRSVRIDRKAYQIHRIIWKLYYGKTLFMLTI